MRHRSIHLLFVSLCVLPVEALAATFGFVDSFADPGVNDWSGGFHLEYTNPGTGGVRGDGDGYLLISSSFQGNFGTKNTSAPYLGNWTAAGITQVTFYLRQFSGSQPFSFHLLITGGSFGTTWQHNTGFSPPTGSWQRCTVDLTNPAGWTRRSGTESLAEVLQNVTTAHFRHDVPPYGFSPDPIAGSLGLDEIQLGPDCNGNGVPDATEPNSDADALIDACDNCPAVVNPDQSDSDADGVGDACDLCPATVPTAAVDQNGCPPVIPGDFDRDGDVDLTDFEHFRTCVSGPAVPQPAVQCTAARLDGDDDVDHDDFGMFQRCFRGANVAGSVNCAD